MSLIEDNGNFYLGNCIYRNNSLNPDNYYLNGENLNEAFNLFTTLANALGYNLFDFGTNQDDWTNATLKFPVFKIAFSGDNNGSNGRLEGKINYYNSDNTAYTFQGKIYDSVTSNIAIEGNAVLTNVGKNNNFTKFIVSASDNSFFFLPIPDNHDAPPIQLEYFLFLRLVNINLAGSQYDQDNIYKHLIITGHLFSDTENPYYLWKSPLDNGILTSGNAEFTIDCIDNQTPSNNWLTDAIFFHDSTTLNNQWIGVADNLVKFAEGDLSCGLTYKQDIGDSKSPYWFALNKITGNKRLMIRVNVDIAGMTEFAPAIEDPYWDNVVLYLKGDGENDSTNIIDSSPIPKTITRFGDIKISTAQSKFGGSSIYLNGNADYLSLSASDDFNFGANNFTIEAWVLIDPSNSFGHLFTINSQTEGVTFKYGVNNSLFYTYSGVYLKTLGNAPFISNSFAHIAYVRYGNDFTVFVNGIKGTTVSETRTIGSSTALSYIGWSVNPSGEKYKGYIDSLRITKGVARYTANFNPETDTYLAY